MDRRILAFLILLLFIFSSIPLTPKAYGQNDNEVNFIGGSNRRVEDVNLRQLPWDKWRDVAFVEGQSRPKNGYGLTEFSSSKGIIASIYPSYKKDGKYVWKHFWIVWRAVPTDQMTNDWLKYEWTFEQYPKKVEWWIERNGAVVKPKTGTVIGSKKSNSGSDKLSDDEWKEYGLIITDDIPAALKFSSNAGGDYDIYWKNVFSVNGASVIKVKVIDASKDGTVSLNVRDDTVLEVQKGTGDSGSQPKAKLLVETNIDWEGLYYVRKVKKDGELIRTPAVYQSESKIKTTLEALEEVEIPVEVLVSELLAQTVSFRFKSGGDVKSFYSPYNHLWIEKLEMSGTLYFYADGELVKKIKWWNPKTGYGIYVPLGGKGKNVEIKYVGTGSAIITGLYSLDVRMEKYYFVEWEIYNAKTGELLSTTSNPSITITVWPGQYKRALAVYTGGGTSPNYYVKVLAIDGNGNSLNIEFKHAVKPKWYLGFIFIGSKFSEEFFL